MKYSHSFSIFLSVILSFQIVTSSFAADKEEVEKKQKILIPDQYNPKKNKVEVEQVEINKVKKVNIEEESNKEKKDTDSNINKDKSDNKEKEDTKLTVSDYYRLGSEAYLLFTEKGYREAIKYFDKALEINKKDALALSGKSKAQSLLTRELSLDEDGLVAIRMQMQAFENAYIASSLEPELSEAHRALSLIYLIQERYDEGKKEAQKSLSLKGANAESNLLLWLNSPDKYKLRSDNASYSKYYEALDINSELIDRTIKLNPNLTLTYLEVGTALASQEKYTQSVDFFEKVLDLSPDNETAYIALGYVYSEISNMDTAIRYFDEALKISPNSVEALHGKAIAYLKKRDKLSAIKYFEQACDLHFEESCDFRKNIDRKYWRLTRPWNIRRNWLRGRRTGY